VQFTPTTYVTTSPLASGGRVDRLDRPAIAALIAFTGWLVFAVARLAGWADGKLSLFIAAGHRYSHPALMFPKVRPREGDGVRRAVLLPLRLRSR